MITVDLPDGHAVADSVRACVPALRAFLMRAQKAVPLAGQVSAVLVSDPAIKRLNRDFRAQNHATDVLSFPAAEIPGNKLNFQAQHRVAGDLAISIDTAARQAKRFGHPLTVELKVLLLHGLLHLAGHDHEIDHGEMRQREEQLRRRFRLPTALIARTLDADRTNVKSPSGRSTRARSAGQS